VLARLENIKARSPVYAHFQTISILMRSHQNWNKRKTYFLWITKCNCA